VPDDTAGLVHPEWQAEFQAAMIKLDVPTLRIRIAAAEALIEKRLQQIANNPDHHLERAAMADALAALRVLKRET
jgi:hypothetical protein